ncbi:MAG TPA: hypothetical protein VOA41_18140 [Candidatus Dormibacteraeota bacterium]|nr:hypothetical protein [Candidatus Dormibacteraeota bacterium]
MPVRFIFLGLLLLAPTSAAPQGSIGEVNKPAQTSSFGVAPGIDAGFRLLYQLKFQEAREQFAAWKDLYRDDPLGDVSMAAAYLFEEFYTQGVLTSEFFLNDKRLLGGIEGKPDPKRKASFNEANEHARQLAKSRLKINPRDADALFALTVAAGMHADYSSILEKHQLEGLRFIKESDNLAKQLIAIRPDSADAYLALGAANYIIGCLPSGKRFVLWFGGIHGDKKIGMQQLRMAAEKGHYLRPYAKIMLALAALREKNESEARTLLTELVAEFPQNHLFVSELAKVSRRAASGTSSQ